MASYPPGPVPAITQPIYTAPDLTAQLQIDLAAQIDAWTAQRVPPQVRLDNAAAYNQIAASNSVGVAAALGSAAATPHAAVMTQESSALNELGTHVRPWVAVSPTAPNHPGTLTGPNPLWQLLATMQNATNTLINNMAVALSGWIFP